MTVEQLNVIITAQTEDFQKKISAVNAALEETAALSRSASEGITGVSIETAAGGTAQVGSIAEENGSESGLTAVGVMGAAARVLNLRNNQTLIGAVEDNTAAAEVSKQQPFQLHTTVELDGEKVGESVNSYNAARLRITNGRG